MEVWLHNHHQNCENCIWNKSQWINTNECHSKSFNKNWTLQHLWWKHLFDFISLVNKLATACVYEVRKTVGVPGLIPGEVLNKKHQIVEILWMTVLFSTDKYIKYSSNWLKQFESININTKPVFNAVISWFRISAEVIFCNTDQRICIELDFFFLRHLNSFMVTVAGKDRREGGCHRDKLQQEVGHLSWACSKWMMVTQLSCHLTAASESICFSFTVDRHSKHF